MSSPSDLHLEEDTYDKCVGPSGTRATLIEAQTGRGVGRV